ncbi:MAG: hypothetical protein HY331_12525 [Chloroflexi bacterium]|nr:hypothetical protein [Chloroflexota bacterium]
MEWRTETFGDLRVLVQYCNHVGLVSEQIRYVHTRADGTVTVLYTLDTEQLRKHAEWRPPPRTG